MTTKGQARAALLVLFVVALFNYIDRSLLSILQVPIKDELGLSDAQLGALTGLSFALFWATAAVPLARLADRVRRTWLLAASLAVWTTMTALSGLAAGFASLAVLRIGVALGEAGCTPTTHSLLSDYFPFQRRGAVFAIWALAMPLGIMFGIFAGGWLSSSLGWRGSFIVIGLIGWMLVPFLLLLREPVRGQHELASSADAGAPVVFGEAVRMLWSIQSMRLLIAGTTLHSFAFTSLQNWMAPFYARVHGMPLSDVALWTALIVGLGAGAGTIATGAFMDALSRRDVRWYGWLLAMTMLLSVPLFLVQFNATEAGISIAAGFAAMFVTTVYVAPVNVVAQSMVHPRMRALTSAVVLLVPQVLGMGLGSLFTGWTSDVFYGMGAEANSLRYALSLTLVASVAGAGCMWWMAGPLQRDLRRSD